MMADKKKPSSEEKVKKALKGLRPGKDVSKEDEELIRKGKEKKDRDEKKNGK